jgi:hypothetical protein
MVRVTEEACMAKFNAHKYTWSKPFTSVRHSWELRSQKGGIHFHATITDGYGASCGLEFHSAEPIGDDAPHHIDCPITGGRCWHDGTSLYANEHLWPMIEGYLRGGEHEFIFRMLEREHDRHFYPHKTEE